MAILILPADDNGDFGIVPERNVSYQLSLILNIKALAMGAQEIIHGSEPVQGIHMVNIIDLSAHFLILIPFQRHASFG